MSASSYDIVCFGSDWFGHPSSTHHLLRRLSAKHRVLWINSIGMRTPQLNGHDLKRVFAKALKLARNISPKQVNEHTWILEPLVLPLQRISQVQTMNKHVFGLQIRAAMKRIGIRNPLVITALPNSVDLIPSLNPRACVYYCLDDFAQMPGVDGDVIGQKEQELARMSDLVMVSSEHLKDHLVGTGTPIKVLPHGVDLERFRTPSGVPDNLQQIKGPRIGFFGALDTWLDLELVAEVAKSRPDWQFPIVGPSRVELSMFDGLDNIHLLGAVPYEDIPNYAAGFDIGILPFEVNSFTKAVNPLKLREYFAAGLPVISTNLPEVAKYEPLAAIADTKDEFIKAAEKLLAEPPQQQALYSAVASEGWGARSLEVESWIAPYV
ncbi:MAG: hypothetical protein CL920_23815 [Deltaproteobacteria bacterium]|nr:hypothetical protein [Deltaproteobacteria bacterium]MBU51729.1 hypothetical protein [Deltaproteobacteria bacterium]|tara:strand:- start:1717 stop:2853 length:1137 start_codon:yes stop_codon:yes gene_type:complete